MAERARFVEIDDERLQALAEDLAPGTAAASGDDPAHVRMSSDDETLAYVVTLDALNFGSGWFPVLRKPEGRSGYFTIATALRRHFEARGPWSAAELQAVTTDECARVFGQDAGSPEVLELMALFSRALADLGHSLQVRAGGSFRGFVEGAGGSAEALVRALAEMPLYRDVSRYDDLEVPLYKRAQITVADLALAFGAQGLGRFDDQGDLTMFADNLVPHVLRCEGVLHYEVSLAERIERAERLQPGSPEEVEIRAVGLHAVERMAGHAGVRAQDLDRMLWQRGQSPRIKRRNRHRTRSVFY